MRNEVAVMWPRSKPDSDRRRGVRRLLSTALLLLVLWIPLGVIAHQDARSALEDTESAGPGAFSGTGRVWPDGGHPTEITELAWLATADGARAEVLVLLQEQADVLDVARAVPVAVRNRTVVETLQRTALRSQTSLRAWLDAKHVSYRAFYVVNALLIEADRGIMTALAERPEVAQIMANPQVALSVPPTDPGLRTVSDATVDGLPWGVQQIGAPQVWALGYRGEGVVVAGQDTGYQWDHPALQTQYRGWSGVAADHDYNWHDAIHFDEGICGADSPFPCDDHGHGTHTMGTMVGDGGDGYQIGVAPGAQWIGCRNMSQGVGTPASYAECFEFFLAPYPVGATPLDGDPDRAPDVVNNSWSCPPYEGCDEENIAFLEQVVDNVRAAGILVVASAGNRGPFCGSVDQPAGMFDSACTVGAVDNGDIIAYFSSRGTGTTLIKPDVVAPGVSVYSAILDGGYGVKSGTSMAAPHVAGAAALLWSARPDLRGAVTATETALAEATVVLTSTQCGDASDAVPNSVYGAGRLDVQRAVELALSGTVAGVVRGPGGALLDNVTVGMKLDDAHAWETTSSTNGFYALAPLSGTYALTASHDQYTDQSYPGIVVSAGLTTTVNITMERKVLLFLPVFFYSP